MKSARLVVVTAAVGAGSGCSGLASGYDGYHPPATATERFQTARLSAVAADNSIATRSGDQALRHNLGITVDQRRAQSPTAPK